MRVCWSWSCPRIVRRVHALLAARSLFAPLARNPYRRHDLRLTYALADRHRPRIKLKDDEAIVLISILYKSRAHRDEVNTRSWLTRA